MSYGRSMKTYEQLHQLLSVLPMRELSNSNWSDTSGWRIAEALDEIVRREGARRIAAADVFAASLDESDGRMSIHCYIATETFEREHVFVGLPQIQCKPDASHLTPLFMSTLMSSTGLSSDAVKRKLYCIAADGAAVLQGEFSGLITRVRHEYAPFVVGNHCAAHKLQLAAKDFEKDSMLVAVMGMVQSVYTFFSNAHNRQSELLKNQKSVGIPCLKMLCDVPSRWLSQAGPMQRTLSQYPALLLTADAVNSLPGAQDAAFTLMIKLCDIELLLGLAVLLPLMEELVSCVKLFQDRVCLTQTADISYRKNITTDRLMVQKFTLCLMKYGEHAGPVLG